MGRAPKSSARKSAKSDFRAKIAKFDAAFAAANRQISTKKNWCDSAVVLEDACGFLRKSILKLGTDLPTLAEDGNAGVVVLALAARDCIKSGAPSHVVGYLRRAMAVQPNHLLLQKLLRQATGIKDPPDLKLRFCPAPFENIETEPGGDVSFCCPAWLPVPIGNLNESTPKKFGIRRARRQSAPLFWMGLIGIVAGPIAQSFRLGRCQKPATCQNLDCVESRPTSAPIWPAAPAILSCRTTDHALCPARPAEPTLSWQKNRRKKP